MRSFNQFNESHKEKPIVGDIYRCLLTLGYMFWNVGEKYELHHINDIGTVSFRNLKNRYISHGWNFDSLLKNKMIEKVDIPEEQDYEEWVEESVNEFRYKVGDIVRITKKEYGHQYEIGDLVKIMDVGKYDYMGEPDKKYKMKWCFMDTECELYDKPEEQDYEEWVEESVNELKYKVGDIVEITNNTCGHRYNIGDKVRIIDINDYDDDAFYDGEEDKEHHIRWLFNDDDCKLYDDTPEEQDYEEWVQ